MERQAHRPLRKEAAKLHTNLKGTQSSVDLYPKRATHTWVSFQGSTKMTWKPQLSLARGCDGSSKEQHGSGVSREDAQRMGLE